MAIGDKWYDNLYASTNIGAEIPANRSLPQFRSDLQQALKRLEAQIEKGLPMEYTRQQVSNFLANLAALMDAIEFSHHNNEENANKRKRQDQDRDKHTQLTNRIRNIREQATYSASPQQDLQLQRPLPELAPSPQANHPRQPRQLHVDANGQLVSVSKTTALDTSLFTLHKARNMILAQLNLWDQRLLRLVCKDWNHAVDQVMRNKAKVFIAINSFDGYGDEYLYDYHVTDIEDLMKLLKRHANVRHLVMWNKEFDRMWTVYEYLSSQIVELARLKSLEFEGFYLPPYTFDMMQDLTQLVSLKFIHCELSGEDLGCLGATIRSITIRGCDGLEITHLLDAMQIFHTRGIPLEELVVSSWESISKLLPLAQFMLENFASLRVLVLHSSRAKKVDAAVNLPKQMLAVNIKKLWLDGMDWPSKSHYRQFFDTLLAQPLPHLQTLYYHHKDFPLEEDIVQRFWQMCLKLDKVDVAHRCQDAQCLERLRLASIEFQHFER